VAIGCCAVWSEGWLMYFDPYAAGYRIQKLRKAHELTQEEAAIKLNISDRHMRSLEKGTYAPLDLFVEIAVHFDVTLDYLILGKVETKTELALSKKINDQKQAMKSLKEQLLAFAMEIEVE
jgi:transcriptional regulator with XRE-family HTH domain